MKLNLKKSDNPEFQLLDGGMGTMLQPFLSPGEPPELLCMTDPEAVRRVHRQYAEAGSRILYTNTFGANRRKMALYGYTPAQIIHAAVALAKEAAALHDAKIYVSAGPVGELMEPMGSLTFQEAYALYREMAEAAEAAGADGIVFETMTDLSEARMALLAAKEHTQLPAAVTMTFEETGRTLTGCTVASMAYTLTGMGASALGINCSFGPDKIYPLTEILCASTYLPVWIKANAGLPHADGSGYDMDAETFAEIMVQYADLGIAAAGGCCGTTPDFIRALARRFQGRTMAIQKGKCRQVPVVCSARRAVPIDQVRIIGERINPTGKKSMQKALRTEDLGYILTQAEEQASAGADILDVNVGYPGVDEVRMMNLAVSCLRENTDLPLQIDSTDPEVIEAGLRAFPGVAIVNSVNGEQAVLERILPVVKKYGACVVGLTLDENGIPQTAEARVAIAERIVECAEAYGISREKVFIDCLTLTLSAQQEQAKETLRALRTVTEQLGLRTVLGVSNISFGLPARSEMNRAFLLLALENGLSLPIMNPNAAEMTNAVRAYRAIRGLDPDAEEYIAWMLAGAESSAAGRGSTALIEKAAEARNADSPEALAAAVENGRADRAKAAAEALVRHMDGLDMINQILIPALDRVGDAYESGKIYLPQLLNASKASQEAFSVIRAEIRKRGAPAAEKGKVILASVKGDNHDIGKNIVKVVLENYGFRVYDLGKDVPAARVVETAIAENVRLIGLSALMTTTLKSMEETIKALRKSGHACKIMVGGAVLTESYAMQIGADYYAKDAKASADIAKKFFESEGE